MTNADRLHIVKLSDRTDCDCCGRQGLKHTMTMSNGQTYGTGCAAKAAGRTAREIRREAEGVRVAAAAARAAEYSAKLAALGPRGFALTAAGKASLSW